MSLFSTIKKVENEKRILRFHAHKIGGFSNVLKIFYLVRREEPFSIFLDYNSNNDKTVT